MQKPGIGNGLILEHEHRVAWRHGEDTRMTGRMAGLRTTKVVANSVPPGRSIKATLEIMEGLGCFIYRLDRGQGGQIDKDWTPTDRLCCIAVDASQRNE